MSRTPLGVITTNLPSLLKVRDNIEIDTDTLLDTFEGDPMILDIESHVVSLTDSEYRVVQYLVTALYTKWKVEFFSPTIHPKHRSIRFTPKDFT